MILTKVFIHRSQHLTPYKFKNINSCLWKSEVNAGCCLGHAMLAFGYTKDNIKDYGTPSRGHHINLELMPKNWIIAHSNASFLDKLMTINDTYTDLENSNKLLESPERERLLMKYGIEAGLDFTFID